MTKKQENICNILTSLFIKLQANVLSVHNLLSTSVFSNFCKDWITGHQKQNKMTQKIYDDKTLPVTGLLTPFPISFLRWFLSNQFIPKSWMFIHMHNSLWLVDFHFLWEHMDLSDCPLLLLRIGYSDHHPDTAPDAYPLPTFTADWHLTLREWTLKYPSKLVVCIISLYAYIHDIWFRQNKSPR